MGQNERSFSEDYKVNLTSQIIIQKSFHKMSQNSTDGSGENTPCEYQDYAFMDLFCGNDDFCETNCTLFEETEILNTIKNYKDRPGCEDIQICGYDQYGKLQKDALRITSNGNHLHCSFLLIIAGFIINKIFRFY